MEMHECMLFVLKKRLKGICMLGGVLCFFDCQWIMVYVFDCVKEIGENTILG